MKLVKVGWLMVGLRLRSGGVLRLSELLAVEWPFRKSDGVRIVIGALSTYFAYRLHSLQAISLIPAITFAGSVVLPRHVLVDGWRRM